MSGLTFVEERCVLGCSDLNQLCSLQFWAALSVIEDGFRIAVEIYMVTAAKCLIAPDCYCNLLGTKLAFQRCNSDWAVDYQACVRAKQNSYRSVLILLILASCHEKCSELDCPGQNTGSTSSSESRIWTGGDGAGTVEGEQAFSLLPWKE